MALVHRKTLKRKIDDSRNLGSCKSVRVTAANVRFGSRGRSYDAINERSRKIINLITPCPVFFLGLLNNYTTKLC